MPVNLPIVRTSLSPAELVSRAAPSVSSIYVHFPFCVTKCSYCDFYSLPGQSIGQMQDYVQAVLKEATWWSSHAISPIRTVFFGGGTPTLLPKDLMGELIAGLRRRFTFAYDVEWTTEANPATVDTEYCSMLLGEGVNRLSVGAQSFIDSELASINRIHNASAVSQTIEAARRAGFDNLSLDLMYALPGQTAGSWDLTLRAALSLGIQHISAYCLTIEEGTPMWTAAEEGKLKQPGEEQQIAFIRQTREFLSSRGLLPYEISNFAAPGFECRHNQMYWKSGNYIGLGAAAASHMAARRWRNLPDVGHYITSVLGSDAVPIADDETLTADQQVTELVMLSLRTREGLSLAAIKHVMGAKLDLSSSSISRLSQLGLICSSPSAICLTDAGVLVADEVIREVVRGLS